MNRTKYFNYIFDKLNELAYKIESKGKLNILDLHMQAENFYLHLLNLIFDWKLQNLNTQLQNVAAIDLIDNTENKIIVQVSATNTKDKIEKTLKKEIIKTHSDYNFKFVSISKDAAELREKTYKNPYLINFNPVNDIFDINSILNIILASDLDKQKLIYKFILKELGNEIDMVKLDSNLATIINILSKENWARNKEKLQFDIDKKISHNNLIRAKKNIEKYSVYHNRLDKIYSEFDLNGVNKSLSVVEKISRVYIQNQNINNEDELFFHVIDEVAQIIMESANFIEIAIDELELCVDILVVDAFIRCEIFENPEL